MERILFRSRTYTDILLLTFAAFFTRSVVFFSIGSYAPMILTVSFGSLIFLGVFTGRVWVKHVLMVWAVLLILFGSLRYLLWGLVLFSGIDEVHILEQFTLWFNVFNILSIATGIYLLRKTRQVLLFA